MAKRKKIVTKPVIEEDESVMATPKSAEEGLEEIDKEIEELEQTEENLDQEERHEESGSWDSDDDEEEDFNY